MQMIRQMSLIMYLCLEIIILMVLIMSVYLEILLFLLKSICMYILSSKSIVPRFLFMPFCLLVPPCNKKYMTNSYTEQMCHLPCTFPATKPTWYEQTTELIR